MILRLILLLLSAFIGSYLLYADLPFYWPVILFGLVFAQFIEILFYQKRLERSIWQFFRSIKNADHSFTFSSKQKSFFLGKIYNEMNRVNASVKDMKTEHEAKERYYQVMLERVSTGIITIDQAGFIQLVNPAALRLLGVSVLNHLSQLERIERQLWVFLKDLTPKERLLLTLQNQSKKLDISVITQTIIVRKESLFVVILQDIKQELDQRELESWIKLIRVQAHEIRNSLAPIAAVSEALLEQKQDEATQAGLKLIFERSQHLKSFVESYRQLTHLPPPHLEKISFSDLMDRLRILLSDQVNFSLVKLICTCNSDEVVEADKNQLTQVLLNVLLNAYQALEGQQEAFISVHLGTHQKGHTITVTDNGPGISKDLLQEIFIPFFSTKETGTGIGLSLSKQIINKHGGELTVENVKEGGARFSIALPKAE